VWLGGGGVCLGWGGGGLGTTTFRGVSLVRKKEGGLKRNWHAIDGYLGGLKKGPKGGFFRQGTELDSHS